MASEPIPSRVRSFIAEHIRSVVELEVLLMLWGSAPKAWSAVEVAREMRVDAAWAQPKMVELSRRGLLAPAPGDATRFIYAPASPTVDEVVKELAVIYGEQRVSVTELIFSMPEEPVRNFADAFKLRKDRTDG